MTDQVIYKPGSRDALASKKNEIFHLDRVGVSGVLVLDDPVFRHWPASLEKLTLKFSESDNS